MANKENNMEILLSKYLEYTPSDTNINKELEVRFNTRKFDNAIQKMDFDRVAQLFDESVKIAVDIKGKLKSRK